MCSCVVAIAISAAAIGGLTGPRDSPDRANQDFEAAVGRVLHCLSLKAGVLPRDMVPDTGVVVATRWLSNSAGPAERRRVRAMHRGSGWSALSGRRRRVGTPGSWMEETLTFRKSNIGGRRFAAALSWFRKEWWHTDASRMYAMHGVPPVQFSATGMRDYWQRKVGPAIGGKVCTKFFLYVRLSKQAGRWRVMRFERVMG